MHRFSDRLKADLTLLLVTVFWGTAFAVLRVALEHHVVHYLNGLRLLLGARFGLRFGELFTAGWHNISHVSLTLTPLSFAQL